MVSYMVCCIVEKVPRVTWLLGYSSKCIVSNIPPQAALMPCNAITCNYKIEIVIRVLVTAVV